jgi:cellulose synthase/poly-beta-1,6-N-acetylglucosamine synthase-like glycosyltransferase
LRNAESRLGTLIGVSGCLYAVRKAAYRPIPPGSISDFVIAMRIRDQGLRTVLEPRAVCFEKALEDPGQELSMRIRVASRSIAALAGERSLLNPFADPLFAWQLWSHKLLRYASPYCWAIVLIACATLVPDLFYRVVLISQLAFIIVGVAGFLLLPHTRKRLGLLGSPYYFLLTNVASFVATVRYLMGKRTVTWNPVR